MPSEAVPRTADSTFMSRWGALTVLCMAMFIIVLDTSMMNVAVPQIASDLDTTVSGVQAVVSLYSLVMASLMLAGAKLGNIHGAVRVYRIALYVYGAGTLLAAVSWNIVVLGVGWSVIEGIGAAALLPLSMSLVVVNYSGARRALAFGVLGGFQASAAAVGPIFGGFLTEYLSWRAGFAFEVVIVIIVLFLLRHLRSAEPDRSQQLDVFGTVLSVLGFGCIVVGSLLAGRHGWWEARRPFVLGDWEISPFGLSVTPVLILAGLGFLAAFGHWQRHREQQGTTPLLRLDILRNGTFVTGFSVDALQSVTLAGVLFVAPLFMQETLGFSPMQAGVALLPLSVSVLVVSMGTASWSSRIEARWLAVAGAALMLVGLVWWAAVTAADMGAWDFFGPLVVFGTGTGLLLAQVPNLTLSSLSAGETDEGSGVQNSAKETGSSLGTAIIGSVMMVAAMTSLVAGVTRAEGSELFGEALDREVVAVEDDLDRLTPEQAQTALDEVDRGIGGQLDTIVGESRVEGLQQALLVVAAFVALALIGATFLPRGKRSPSDDPDSESDDEGEPLLPRRGATPQRGY